jgi:formylglycine-generating enzyme required for sulfatase activity
MIRNATAIAQRSVPRLARRSILKVSRSLRDGASNLSRANRPGCNWRDADHLPLMVELPPGEFIMGENPGDKFANDTERPAHLVRISAGLAFGRLPVTVGEFRRFRPGHALDEPDEWPVVRVNWFDAIAYGEWLSAQSGRVYRLPSEAEWEYACRAGSRSAFSTGDEITPAKACYLYNENGRRVGIGGRTPAGHYAGNAFGLCDLHGNVNEWTQDTWHPDYGGAPNDGRAWIAEGDDRRVMRGGAWDYLPRLLRSSWRDWRPAEERADNLGFRVVTSDAKIQRLA